MKWRSSAVPLLFLLLSVTAYWPVLTTNYGYNDDYRILQEMRRGSFDLLRNDGVAQGRPLGGVWHWLAFKPLKGIDDLKRMRLAAVAGIAVFAAGLYFFHRRAGASRRTALGVSALVSLTPAFAVYAAWLTLGCGGYCALAGLSGGWLVWDAVDRESRQRGRLIRGVSGGVLIVLSLLTYQPLALMCVYAFFVLARGRESSGGNAFPVFSRAVAVFFLSVAVYYALYRFSAQSLAAAGGQFSRGMISTNFADKGRYLIEVLWSSLALWTRFAPTGVSTATAAGMLVLGAAGVLGPSRRSSGRTSVMLLVSVPLSVLPVLIVAENDLQFRSHVGTQALAVCAAASGMAVVWRKLGTRVFRRVFDAGATGIVIVSVTSFLLLARSCVQHGLVDPNAREIVRLRQAVGAVAGGYPAQVVYFSPEPGWLTNKDLSEFGVIASPALWNMAPLLELLLDEKFGRNTYDGSSKPLQVLVAQGTMGSAPVIDGFGALHREELTALDDPYWGALRKLPSGWCVSNWFGAFDGRRFPSIWHAKLGWLICSQRAEQFWFWHTELGWIFTNPQSFPAVYVQEKGEWLWIEQDALSSAAGIPLGRPTDDDTPGSQRRRGSGS